MNQICSQSYGPEVRCIRTNDRQIQAVTSLSIEYKSFLEPGEKAIYIDRLATAPWNRGWLVREPQYNRCGLGLIRYVVVLDHFERVTRGLPDMLTLGKGLVDITVTVASFLYCTDWV